YPREQERQEAATWPVPTSQAPRRQPAVDYGEVAAGILVEAREHPPEVSGVNLAHRGIPGMGRTRAGLQVVGGDSVAARHPLLVGQMRAEGVLAVILPKDRDPRFITIRRGGTLIDSDHRLLALWAASCAEHVL